MDMDLNPTAVLELPSHNLFKNVPNEKSFHQIGNIALMLTIDFFFINICDNKQTFILHKQSDRHTTFQTNLHSPIANLPKFQKGVYYPGIKIFNNLPHNIKYLANEITLFRNALERFLLIHSFYNSEEYFNYQR